MRLLAVRPRRSRPVLIITLGVLAVAAMAAVGGIAEYPDVAGSSGSGGYNYLAGAAVGVLVLVALAAGAWYARRRWVR